MPTSTARAKYFDANENLDVFQVVGPGGTPLAGQTIQGFSYGTKSALDNQTALAGGGQSAVSPLVSINRFTVVVNNGDSATLPVAQPGMTVIVINDGAHSLNIFPALGDTINALGTNNAFSLATGQSPLAFYCTSGILNGVAGQWRTK